MWKNGYQKKSIDKFSSLENQAFINGKGQGTPHGILQYPEGKGHGKIELISSKDLSPESIYQLYYSLNDEYVKNGVFLMSRRAIHAIRTLKDKTSGQYLWEPSLADGTPETILGSKVMHCPEMPDGNDITIAFGDFKSGYQIVDRQGIRVLRDPFTEKPYIKFYATKRVGGAVTTFDAIKLLKIKKK